VRNLFRRLLVVAVFVAGLPSLQAQDSWDSAFKLCYGSVGTDSKAPLGNGTQWAIGAEGTYHLFPVGSLTLEGGYRTLNDQTTNPTDLLTVTEGSKGFYCGALYRYSEFSKLLGGTLDGLYLQGGLRFQKLKTNRTEDLKTTSTDENPTRTDYYGPNVGTISPVVGVGFRFNDKLSLEFSYFRMKGSALRSAGTSFEYVEQTSAAYEFALGVHL
jgi:hypothetical protein